MGFYFAQFLTGLASASSLFLVAAGLSIIFGVTRIVNFAHGSLFMLGAFIAYSISQKFGFWLAVPLAALSVGAVGWAMERTVLSRLYGAPELFQLVATFGLVLIVQDAALWIWGPTDLLGPRAPGLTGVVRIFDQPIPEYDLFLIAVGVSVLAAIWWMFTRTRFGILVRAATEDREMLQALGVRPARLFQATFFIGAALAGLGGALEMPRQPASLLMDLNIIAEAFVVVVIGGMGSVTGAFLAALLIAELNAFGILILPEITLVAAFAAMAVVLVIRPYGLLGRPATSAPHAVEIQPPQTLGQTGRITALGLVIALVVLPFVAGDFVIVLTADIMIFALFAAGLHFMMGTGGLVSFGHAAFFGIGAYAAALLVNNAGLGMEIALFLAPVFAAIGAAVVGWFAVRLSGVYLAMLTLAAAQILWSASVQWQDVTGGDDGILGIWPAAWASGTTAYYYLTFALTTSGIVSLMMLARGRFGILLRAGRDAPARAQALGIDIKLRNWTAIVIAGSAAGLAGGIFAFSKGSVFPDTLAIPNSVDALVMVLLGGLHAPAGPILGAGVFALLEDSLSRLPYWRALLGAAVVGIALFAPGGIAGSLSKWLRRRREGTA
ncbi:MAG: ABC transporter permease [Rhodospirillales bacterium]|nr:ABC transporter permease [Rhodospirillales bacterium]